MKSKFFLIAGLTAVMFASSCSEHLENDALSSSQSLIIEISDANLDGKATTRAAYSGYTTTFESGDIIGLYVVKGSRVINANVPYTFNGTAWTTSSTVEYNDSYSYYAYYPYISSPYTPNFAQSTVDGKFSNFLTDTSDKFHKANQSTKANFQASDLMIAEGSKSGSNTVSFSMLHKKGMAVFNGDGAADATFTGNIPYLMGTTKYFLMKPSHSTSFTDDEGTYSLSAASGRYVTHNVEGYTNYILNVVGPSSFTYSGGTNAYGIQSYKQNSAGTKSKAAAWTASYDTNGDGVFNDSKPSWLTAFTASGDGSTTTTNYSATVSAQSAMSPTSVSASSVLAAATPVGSSSDYYDLSTNGGVSSMTTANCYMVHAPGYYKLPLVYGNAIKNGTDNTVAYNPGGTASTTYCTNFVNHSGNNISAPWITKSGSGVNGGMNITVDGAQLIWQDVNGLTTNYTIEGDYLKFQIPAGSIAEGNAVIAVKSGSTIVWSWHIWVTPETYGNLTTVATGSHNYHVTPVNLGWVSSNVTKSGYEGRSCVVKITQAGGDAKTFTVRQAENISVTFSKTGNSPFYQWGRKDAFPPSNGTDNTNKTVYVSLGVDSRGWLYNVSTTSTIGTTIQYPWKLYYSSTTNGAVTTTYYNMWDAQNNTIENVTTATKKTIYDPCPPGFCIPTGNLWYYFGNGGRRDDSNWDSTNKGKTWNTDITGDALWFPATGRRGNSGDLKNVGLNGYFWSATPSNDRRGRCLTFHSSRWMWNYDIRAFGYSVRPVAEE